MPYMFRLAAAAAIAMAIAASCVPSMRNVGPFAGSELAVIGVVMGGAFVVVEVTEIVRSVRRARARKVRAKRKSETGSLEQLKD